MKKSAVFLIAFLMMCSVYAESITGVLGVPFGLRLPDASRILNSQNFSTGSIKDDDHDCLAVKFNNDDHQKFSGKEIDTITFYFDKLNDLKFLYATLTFDFDDTDDCSLFLLSFDYKFDLEYIKKTETNNTLHYSYKDKKTGANLLLSVTVRSSGVPYAALSFLLPLEGESILF